MDCDLDDYEKLPGYFRVWDLAQVILAGRRYRVEDIGMLADGGALFAVFETSIAKMRVFRVPEFLGAALMLGLLATLLRFVSGSL